MLREILQEIPSKVLPNFSQPLVLTDFLVSVLEDQSNIENQVFALKGMFILLQ